MKKRFNFLLCFILCFGMTGVGQLGAAADFDYDMAYFEFTDGGVSGDRHPEYVGDGDMETAWSTVDAQKAGMRLIIDMMQIQDVGKIILHQPEEQYPAKFNVYLTRYKEDWGAPVLTDVSGSALETTTIDFDTEVSARFIMIELAEGTEENANPWAINEVEVLSIADSSRELQDTNVTTDKDPKESAEEFLAKVRMLNALDIGLTGEENPISKTTFLEWLLKFSNQYQNILSAYDGQSFTDVPASSANHNMVEYAVRAGILKAGGAFEGARNITGNEAAEMAVRALGYGVYADNGYAAASVQAEVSQGVDAAAELTEQGAVRLFFNMIEIPLLELSLYGDSYSVDDTQANYAGYVWQKIYKVRGIVNTNSRTNLTGNPPLLYGLVKVDDTLYSIGDTNAEEFLGYNVEMYVRDTGGDEDEILAVYGYRNTYVQIPAPNMIRAESDTVTYLSNTSDAKEQKARMAENFNMVYNGVVMIPTDITKLNIQTGSATLVDNNNDGKYDVALADEYINYYVGYINQADQIIYDDYSNPALTLGLKNDRIKSVQYYKNGEEAVFSAIKTGMVVSVAADKTMLDANGNVIVDTERAEVYTVYLSDETISGTVTGINRSEHALEVDGRKYLLNGTFLGQCDAGSAKIPDLGANVTLYLDYCGEIAAVETLAADGYVYGYATRIFYDDILEQVGIRMFLQSGTPQVLYLAERVTIDGIRYQVDENFIENYHFFQVADASTASGYKFDPQLLMYKCNSEGEITFIDSKTYDPVYEDKSESINFYARSEYAFNTYRNMLYPNAEGDSNPNFVTNSMLIFVVPATESYRDNNDYYRVYDKSYLQHDQYYDMEVYKKTDFNEATVVVIYKDVMGGGSSVNGNSNMVMVDEVGYALDPNEEVKIRLLGTNGRSDLVMYFKDETVLENAGLMNNGEIDLHRGDVVQLTDTSGSDILGLTRVYDVENLDIELTRGGKYYQASRTTIAQVYDANASYMMLSSQYLVDDERAAEYSEVYPLATGVVYDQETDRVRKATADDIKAYKKMKDVANTSIVIVNTVWGDVQWCIIYNLENYVPSVSDQG